MSYTIRDENGMPVLSQIPYQDLTSEEVINEFIQDELVDTDLISDGYHTFLELYDHRVTIFIALCRMAQECGKEVWRSKRHSDGELCFGTGTQYVLGIGKDEGEQITYHVTMKRWDETNDIQELDKAPTFDGHTSKDVLDRLKDL